MDTYISIDRQLTGSEWGQANVAFAHENLLLCQEPWCSHMNFNTNPNELQIDMY